MAALFTPRADRLIRQGLAALLSLGALTTGVIWYTFTPKYTRVGFRPEQPVGFSHELHVGGLGMSCLYCHHQVDESPHSNVPPTQTCMNCHTRVQGQSPLLAAVRTSYQSGQPMHWQRVHKLPDYAYFNHAVHIHRGVSCVSCHGQINEMPVVYHDQPLSMGWCLECHRNPAPNIRPRGEVTNLTWTPPEGKTKEAVGKELVELLKIKPPETCQACHR